MAKRLILGPSRTAKVDVSAFSNLVKLFTRVERVGAVLDERLRGYLPEAGKLGPVISVSYRDSIDQPIFDPGIKSALGRKCEFNADEALWAIAGLLHHHDASPHLQDDGMLNVFYVGTQAMHVYYRSGLWVVAPGRVNSSHNYVRGHRFFRR